MLMLYSSEMRQFRHARWLAISLGSILVSAWTLLRFWLQPVIFDAVGQQVLAHQWLQGFHSGAVTGPTNYIVKILLLYMPADLLPGNPYIKLVAMTILLNVVTYVAIFLGIEWIAKRFSITSGKPVWLVMLWMAVVSGSVFWIGFANSRNIEVAGGVWLLITGLRVTTRSPARITWLPTLALSSILFFADPLQLYMAAIPAALFMTAELWLTSAAARNPARPLIWAAVVMLGYAVSRVLTFVTVQIWHVHFFPIATHVQLGALPKQTILATRQLLELYSGSADLGRVFLCLNPVLFVIFLAACIWAVLTKPGSRRLFLWAGIIVTVDLGVYVLSGSTGQATNSRYLIMTLPAVAVSFAGALWYSQRWIKAGLYGLMSAACVIGVCLIAFNLVRNYQPGLSRNHHYAVVDSFIASGQYPYGYASMNAALPVTYLYNDNAKLLPLSCQADGRLSLSSLFFDRAYMGSILQMPARDVPVILDEGGVITNVPAVCSKSDVTNQLGLPEQMVKLSDGSEALIYNSAALRQRVSVQAMP